MRKAKKRIKYMCAYCGSTNCYFLKKKGFIFCRDCGKLNKIEDRKIIKKNDKRI